MKLTQCILYSIKALDNKIPPGKTTVQKILYFSLPGYRDLYKPHLYGPYSEVIDWMMLSLMKNGYIEYDNKNKRLTTKYQINPEKNRGGAHMDIDKTIEILQKHGFSSSQDIANLAKIHMFYCSNQKKSTEELITFIKERSDFLGWKPVVELKKATIRKYIEYSKEMEYSIQHVST